MAEIKAAMVKDLREKTSAPFLDCKNALVETEGNFEKATEILRIKGVAKASKKTTRKTDQGIISSYVHAGGKIGVMLEVNCETDFVARNDEFQNLCREVAMQIAANNPVYVRKEEVSEEEIENEKRILKAEAMESGKPENIAEKMVAGRINKFFEEICLLEQPYIRDPKIKIVDLVNNLIAKIGENIVVKRFVRYQLGE
ncbi:MAG: translation elongation factor Ts [Candidatus Dadabacteria bacterium]|nr:translation elongation factor Ts [Candidatus Dadabacteria bacterium]MYA49013.1 translation elongation factor Ts [Candidatus Dadabacteria bacterium]MYG82391.1 translation elongation factor Ts [Candidatus Dadabacteria bacterium]MYK49458.1 translation elongation factor Ts [Candidatus Dadabacteria bacterium]